MLTGVETAGLVLAAFPVVVQLIQGYKEGCQPLRNWFRFHKTFQKLIQGIRLQETRLESNVRMLLLPLVDNDEELEVLLGEPGGGAWKNPDLEDALQLQLSNSFKSYLDTIERIRETLQDFRHQLGVGKDIEKEIQYHLSHGTKGLRSSKSIDWAFEWNRVKVSWARKELVQIIEELDRLNTSLKSLLSDSEKLDALEQSRTARKSGSIQQLRNHASALYNFLAKQWPCSCEKSHNAHVFLRHQPIPDSKEPAKQGRRFRSVKDYSFEISLAFETHGDAAYTWCGPVACTLQDYRSPPQQAVLKVNKTSLKAENTFRLGTGLKKRVTIQDPPNDASSTASLVSQSTTTTSISSTVFTNDSSLCEALVPGAFDEKLGPFIEGGCQLFILPSSTSSSMMSPTPPLTTLADLLKYSTEDELQTPVLPMPLRVKLAVDLASSFFYIYGTPWYAQAWGKYEVKLALQDGRPVIGPALIERRFPDNGKSQPPTFSNPQDAFIRLAICLEELCFGRPLESLPIYSRFCGSDGQPHAKTLHHTAQELVERIEHQSGPYYHDAVKKCLGHAWFAESSEASKPEFWQKAHDDVVEPLKKVLQAMVI